MPIAPLGHRERHLRRKANSCLFLVKPDDTAVDKARREDRAEADGFAATVRALVQRAVDLQPNEESEVVLALKAEIDKQYVIGCSLVGDHSQLLQGLARLNEVIMTSLHRSAEGDPTALEELRNEALARETHLELLAHPLVADLMRPGGIIGEEELVATLLSEAEEAMAAALWLFTPEQISEMALLGEQLLVERAAAGCQEARFDARLKQLRSAAPAAGSFSVNPGAGSGQ